MSLTNAGLTNSGSGPGVTAHYAFSYDSALSHADGLVATNALIAGCEQDFALMQGWFNGINIPFDYPLGVQVTANSGGASWTTPSGFLQTFGSGSYVSLKPGPGQSGNFLRYLLVSEVTEMLMMQQDAGWFTGQGFFSGGDEGSMGEGLSRFLGTQFLVHNGLGSSPFPGYEVTRFWLNGTRPNFVDSDPDDHTPDPATGCTTLFIYYLYSQLGVTIEKIIRAGSSSMEGVYTNLKGNNQGWNKFIELVDLHYPPGTVYHPAGDNVFPVSDLREMTVPSEITCGYSKTGEIVLNKPAMAEVFVQLTSSDENVISVASPVHVPVGATSVQFTLRSVAKDLPFGPSTCKITASYAGEAKAGSVTVVSPEVSSLSVSPAPVICGDTAVVTVTLDAASVKGPATVSLVSGDTSLLTITSPVPLVIAKGVASAAFEIATPNITAGFAPKTATVSATLGGKTKTLSVQIVSPTVRSVDINPNPATGGTQATATVTLDRVSNKGDVLVQLNWDLTPNQPTLNIPQGHLSNFFLIDVPITIPPFGDSQAILYASYDVNTVSATLNMTPGPNAGVLASLTVPTEIHGGGRLNASVTLEHAVNTDTIVGLGASQTARTRPGSVVPLPGASVPGTVTVPANALSATFQVTTSPLPAGAVSHTMAVYASAVNTKIVIVNFLS